MDFDRIAMDKSVMLILDMSSSSWLWIVVLNVALVGRQFSLSNIRIGTDWIPGKG